jgi:hypothetical protein
VGPGVESSQPWDYRSCTPDGEENVGCQETSLSQGSGQQKARPPHPDPQRGKDENGRSGGELQLSGGFRLN